MKSIEMRTADFKRSLEQYAFSKEMKDEFFEYWSEPNKSGTLMRYESEKTWDLDRRLNRWARNNFGKHNLVKTETGYREKPEVKEPVTELEKLDFDLMKYRTHFENIKFQDMGKWYDFMKRQRLLRTFTKEDIDIIKLAYGQDNYKCRCACVQMTFDFMVNIGRPFKWIKDHQIG